MKKPFEDTKGSMTLIQMASTYSASPEQNSCVKDKVSRGAAQMGSTRDLTLMHTRKDRGEDIAPNFNGTTCTCFMH